MTSQRSPICSQEERPVQEALLRKNEEFRRHINAVD